MPLLLEGMEIAFTGCFINSLSSFPGSRSQTIILLLISDSPMEMISLFDINFKDLPSSIRILISVPFFIVAATGTFSSRK